MRGGHLLSHGLLAVAAMMVTLGASAASSIKLSPAIQEMYTAVEVPPPASTHMTVCYGFICRLRLELAFSAAERTTIRTIMAKGQANAEAERAALQQVVVWFDRRVAQEVGTHRRVPRADFRHLDDKHNFDCYDTTRNTVGLLLVLNDWGLLKHHTVADPRYRGKFLFGQTPHNTAVLKERAGGREWAIDMWTTAYGQVPDVMPIEKWLKEN